MALNSNESKGTYLREGKGLQKGKYTRRRRVYLFDCADCGAGIEVYSTDLAVSLGRCKLCASKGNAKKMARGNRKRPYEALYNSFAGRRQPGDMTFEEFVTFTCVTECHYCAAPLSWSEFDLENNGYGCNLDRKDNSISYTADNCVPCCWKCNRAKGSVYSYEEFVAISRMVAQVRRCRELSPAIVLERERQEFLVMNDFDFGE